MQRVELRGDVAWVELTTDAGGLSLVRFYRQTERGWLHTVPGEAFWGDPVHVIDDGVIVYGSERDLAHLERVGEAAAALRRQLCTALACGDAPLRVDVEVSASGWPDVTAAQVTLPSPSLVGVYEDGTLSEVYLDELAYRTAYALAGRTVDPDPEGRLNPLQRAIVEQVAASYGRGPAADTPILGRIIARYGDAVVPEVLDSLRGMGDLDAFLQRWFAVTPGDPERYNALLLDIMLSPGLHALDETEWFLLIAVRLDGDEDVLEEWVNGAR